MSIGNEKKILRTACSLGDGVVCGLAVEVSNGVITKVSPADMPNPADRGACSKGLAAMELVYHKDRLRYPLKRIGQRGEGKWERISWEEALDDIADKLRKIAMRYESRSIAWVTRGSPAELKGGGYIRLASLLKGSRVSIVGFGDSAAPCADLATFGCMFGDAHLTRMADPKLTIVWGQNPDVTDWRRMHRIMESRKKGGKVVVIDPRCTSTAARAADEYIPIRPGTDAALALGMIRVVLEQGRQDERFITENTVGPLLVRSDNGLLLRESDVTEGGSRQRFMVFDANTGSVQPYDIPGVKPSLTGCCSLAGMECRTGFQLLADMVQGYTPEIVSVITDIPADVIRRLAADYGAQKPSSIHRGWGFQRTFHGDLTCRAINTLAAVTGNINPNIPSRFALNMGFATPGGPYTNIPIMSLYDQIAKQEPFPIKALWFSAKNFVSQMPNQNRIVHELFPQLDLIVVSDIFMTVTAKYADYVLPASSPFEYTDLLSGLVNWTNYLHLQQKVIEPLYESKPDFQIAAELGRRMGLEEYFDKTEEQYLGGILTSDHPTMEGISLGRLKAGPIAERIIDSPQKFPTPTGRIEFYVERLKQFGQELPIYLEPVESTRSAKAKEYPLSLLTSHPRYRVHTAMANCPSMLKADPEPTVQINPVDAERRGVCDGGVVRVFNDLGQVKLKAALSERIKPGVINIDEGWWPEHYIAGHINELTHERINAAQTAIFEPNAALCDVLVEVEKV